MTSTDPVPSLTFTHPALGPIKARLVYPSVHGLPASSTPPIANIRCIPYATIPARFKQSVLVSNGLRDPAHFNDGRPRGDFTQYGYTCPQVPQGSAAAGGPTPEGERRYDELTCLTATVSAPAARLQDGQAAARDEAGPPLPVTVYVRGGAFKEGAGPTSAGHDAAPLAALARRQPSAAPSSSSASRTASVGSASRRAGACWARRRPRAPGRTRSSYGLRDQRNASRWIRENVGGVGGDAASVTAFGGERGGRVAGDASECRGAAVQARGAAEWHGGTAGAVAAGGARRGVRPAEENGEKRVARLKEAPVQRLVDAVDALSMATFSPYMGEESGFFTVPPSYLTEPELAAKCDWVEDVMLGDCFFEGKVLEYAIKDLPPTYFVRLLKDIYGEESARRVLDAIAARASWATCGSRSRCTRSAVTLARHNQTSSKKKRVYRYNMCISNPFTGSELSVIAGHHFVDVLYLFLTLTFRTPSQRDRFYARMAVEMGRKWILFGNGLPPWEAEYDAENGNIAVLDDWRGRTVRTKDEDMRMSKEDPWSERRYRAWDILREVFTSPGRNADGEYDAAKIEAAPLGFQMLQ
ncbi:Alpha/Beta hydrolase protein [Lineolata rhizophorae]|uniref:Alpha/Beta hydrolase protein n=1 Tax=Lineolata rhizophorae TaxID=578093 RepID=A0A6A6NSM2_9PEZI|nr:Alpha/Beta hydrolase protein [Lineolata rhizophorae]